MDRIMSHCNHPRSQMFGQSRHCRLSFLAFQLRSAFFFLRVYLFFCFLCGFTFFHWFCLFSHLFSTPCIFLNHTIWASVRIIPQHKFQTFTLYIFMLHFVITHHYLFLAVFLSSLSFSLSFIPPPTQSFFLSPSHYFLFFYSFLPFSMFHFNFLFSFSFLTFLPLILIFFSPLAHIFFPLILCSFFSFFFNLTHPHCYSFRFTHISVFCDLFYLRNIKHFLLFLSICFLFSSHFCFLSFFLSLVALFIFFFHVFFFFLLYRVLLFY